MIIFIVAHDAYLRAAEKIIRILDRRLFLDIKICTTSKQLSLFADKEIEYINLEQFDCESYFKTAKIVFAGLGGRDLNRLISVLSSDIEGQKPKVVSYFPGVVQYRMIEAFTTRLLCDFVLLNSRRDYRIFNWIANRIEGSASGVLFGAPWVSELDFVCDDVDKDIDLLFVEQSLVPLEYQERVRLTEMLVNTARENPEDRFCIKLRANKYTATADQPTGRLDEILLEKFSKPSNLWFDTAPVDSLLKRSRCVATISSSVAFDSVLSNINTLFINDFGISASIGNEIYYRSGCMSSLKNYRLERSPKPAWVEMFMMKPLKLSLNELLTAENRSYESGLKIRVSISQWIFLAALIFGLCWRYPNHSLEQFKMLKKTINNINKNIYQS